MIKVFKMRVKEAIYALGGPAKVAKSLGFEGRNGACRVSMWILRNKIPAEIQLQNLEFFKAVEHKSPAVSSSKKSRA